MAEKLQLGLSRLREEENIRMRGETLDGQPGFFSLSLVLDAERTFPVSVTTAGGVTYKPSSFPKAAGFVTTKPDVRVTWYIGLWVMSWAIGPWIVSMKFPFLTLIKTVSKRFRARLVSFSNLKNGTWIQRLTTFRARLDCNDIYRSSHLSILACGLCDYIDCK